jgi:hypothetical protein
METPHLNIGYQPRDFRAFCQMGQPWKVLTEQAKEPLGFAERLSSTF